MKKILNRPESYVDEMLAGMCLAHPGYFVQSGPQGRTISRPEAPVKGKVGIVTGGGSGHLPVFTGYVGKGLLDAAAIGDVFASPTVQQISATIQKAESGEGVLLLYGNYGGDVMNFDMAAEMLEMENVKTKTVLVADDVISAQKQERAKRRGTGGLIYAFKAAGAAAEQGGDLDAVAAAAQKAADACHSVGMALSPCTIPQVGKPTFTLGENEMEMGMGIHGEPGIRRENLKSADAIVEEMLGYLLDDRNDPSGKRVALTVNSLGATPLEELYIAYKKAREILDSKGIEVFQPWVGRYATSMEMAGMTMTLCEVDDELARLLSAACDCPFLKIGA